VYSQVFFLPQPFVHRVRCMLGSALRRARFGTSPLPTTGYKFLRFFDDERALRVSARCGTLCISTSIMGYGFGEHIADV
jgi:hypothetical protein